ncbi:type I polyketide synthase [Umezawaea beigongshangensis]|uniref:type I polyketide synthase n=1 Tax=Umezawaea beigongshangensis TaxID=2780383 RepID=UPI0018F1E6ED|nr:type I polyketide synthase [Umezawaea beigongshangensis]
MIAVVGAACRFPGAADAEAYWDLLIDGRSGLTRLSEEDMRAAGTPPEVLRSPGLVPVAGLIAGQDLFDPEPFGLTDAEAALMDPQQRLFLRACWEALENAGHGGGRGAGTVGVYAGSAHSAYLTANLPGRWDPAGGGTDPVGSLRTAIATHADYLPLHVAHRLDLTGPAVSVATTCSTSLVAVHTAAQALLAEECDTALAGGVSLIVPQGRGYVHVPDGIYSADGVVRPYSARGTGIVYSQGVGAVVLRRLEDALADGDPVLAVLRGSAVSNDGADRAGFTAPSPRGQARAIAEAQAVAGVAPRAVGYVEGHGTATALGDPVEVAALRTVFGSAERPWCGLGSVKGNIGHANSAAGVASLIKTVLALSRGSVPPSLHAEPLNPALGLEGSPFEVVTTARPWSPDAPFAGVSSFGIGGTNCHVVLGPPPAPRPVSPDPRPQVLVVSGRGDDAARGAALALADHVEGVGPDVLADLAHTLDVGRVHQRRRVAVVASPEDPAAAARTLRTAVPVPVTAPAPRVVFAFPGAGSQYGGMGGGLYEREPVFAEAVDECAALLRPLLGVDVREVVRGTAAEHRVRDAALGLPALFTVSLATARLLAAWGVRPDAVLGHSLGEYTAAVVAGGLELRDAARLVAVRCTEVSRVAGNGAMLSLDLGADEVRTLLGGHPLVDLAVVNGPRASVVSGPSDAVAGLAAEARRAGVRCRELRVDAALHSRLVDPAVPAVRRAAAGLPAPVPTATVVSTLTGGPVLAELATAEHWARQLREPVRFSEALRAAVGAGPSLLVQVGPGAALVSLARSHALPGLVDSVGTLDHERRAEEPVTVREAVARLWARGADVALPGEPGARRRVAAPGYAFQERRLWIDPPAEDRPVPRDLLLHRPRWQRVPVLPARVPRGRFALVRVGGDVAVHDALRAATTWTELSDVDGPSLDGLLVLAGGDDVAAVVRDCAELARTLTERGVRPAVLLTAAAGADAVESADRPNPAATAAKALTRVLAQEQRVARWRTADTGPLAPAEAAAALLAELADLAGGGEVGEVAPRGRVRWQREVVPHAPDPAEPVTLRGGWAVVAGGLGDVGLVVAAHLARAGARVVVTSRRPVSDVPHARRALAALAGDGCDITTRVLDAADPAGWERLLVELAGSAPVAVVVHAAGAAATAGTHPLRVTGAEQVARQLHGKAGGAVALREAVRRLPASARPASVLLMSSAAVLVGGIGTGAYAAANAVLDATAEAADDDTATRWTSVVWDGWKVGPGGDERTVVLRDALDAATGASALERVLALHRDGRAESVVAVSRTDLRARSTAPVPVGDEPGEGDELTDPVQRRIAALWSELFGVPVRSADADFFALGGHSLLATGMLTSLGREHDADLRLRDLLDAPTVGALAGLVRERAGGSASAPVTTAAVPAAEVSSWPLTRVQHAYWVGRDGGYRWGDVPCHFYLEHDCAELDVARHEEAWNRVVARHPSLRAVVDAQGSMTVLPEVPRYRIRVHDLREVGEAERERRLASLRERVSRKPGPSDRWPLFQVRAALLPHGRVRLFTGVDVLVCDAASWGVIDRELRHHHLNPDVDLPPVGVHPAECVRALEERRDGPAGQRAATYWRERLAELPAAPALPLDDAADAPRFQRHAAVLDAPRWRALRETAARHRVTPTAVLLTVYADVLAAWSGQDSFSVVLTLFDRPDVHPDVAHVVGDFTSLVLHAVDRSPAESFAERVRRTQRRLFDDLDHREFSALEVLAERSAAAGELVSVPVVFTSALGLSGEDHDPAWAGERVAALSQTPQTLLDHQVLEEHGELHLQWDALHPVLPPDRVRAAVAEHAERVRLLADDPDAWGSTAESGVDDGSEESGVDDEDVAVLLRAGTGRRTLFLLHPSGGDVLCYADLARRLDPAVSVVALTDPGLSGAGAPESVTGLARLYAGVVRRYQPSGPYLLGGWSMGGDLAHEVARVLHEQGLRTAALVLLDSHDPSLITATPGEAELARRYLASLEGYLDVDLGSRERTTGHVDGALQREVDDALTSHGLLRPGDTAATRLEVFARHLRGLAEHTPRPLPDPSTRALVVRAARTSPRNSGIGMGVDDVPAGVPDLGWSAHLAGPVRLAAVDAHHYSLLRGDAVSAIADLVDALLHRTDDERHTP